jgi:hypothetical protein
MSEAPGSLRITPDIAPGRGDFAAFSLQDGYQLEHASRNGRQHQMVRLEPVSTLQISAHPTLHQAGLNVMDHGLCRFIDVECAVIGNEAIYASRISSAAALPAMRVSPGGTVDRRPGRINCADMRPALS